MSRYDFMECTCCGGRFCSLISDRAIPIYWCVTCGALNAECYEDGHIAPEWAEERKDHADTTHKEGST